MKYIKNIIFIVGIFILIGCGSSQQLDIAQPTLPSWYTHPPHSDTTTLYALGDGKTKQEALTNALNNLIATLSVSLSSEYNAKTIVKEGSHSATITDATYENEVHAQVKKIRISNYEVLEAKKLGFKHYATLVKVEKKALFQGLQSEIDQKFTFFNGSVKGSNDDNVLKQLHKYEQFIQEFDTIKNTLSVMSVLNPHFHQKIYIDRMLQIEKTKQSLLQKISFSIIARGEAKKLQPSLAKGLSDAHYIVKQRKDKYHFTIVLSSKTAYAHSYGFYLARSVLTLVTKNIQGSVIGSNTLHITGQSSQSKAIAQQDVAKKLTQLIEKEGIEKVLGI